MNKYGWGRQLNVGRMGEELILNYLLDFSAHGKKHKKQLAKPIHPDDFLGQFLVSDVRKEKTYQEKDIDFLIMPWDKKRKVKIEVKTDTYHHTGNYFFETISNKEKDNLGCFLASKADYWYYVFMPQKEIHIIPLKKARAWFKRKLKADPKCFKIKKLGTKFGAKDKDYYSTEGCLVPREAVPGVTIIKIK